MLAEKIINMTEQELFDTVCRYAATMTEKSRSTSGDNCGCLYRGPNGNKCFIGFLIDDKEYNASLNNGIQVEVCWEELVDSGLAPSMHGDFLIELQAVHDMNAISDWRYRLHQFAEKFNLDPTVLDSLEFAVPQIVEN